MGVIARKTLRDFWESRGHEDAKRPLESWLRDTRAADWKCPADVKASHGNASVVANNRVVFNIAGNKYRLVVAINDPAHLVFIRFVGPRPIRPHRRRDDSKSGRFAPRPTTRRRCGASKS